MPAKEKKIRLSAKKGNSANFTLLFRQYLPVMYKLKKRYYLQGYDRDDWLQESRIIFFNSLKAFDEKHGLSFGYFYKMNLERHIFSLLRKQGAFKRRADRLSSSLEATIEEQGDFLVPYVDLFRNHIVDNMMFKENMLYFVDSLSPYEGEVFDYYMRHFDPHEIALKTKTKITQVQNAFDRIKKKLKEHT